jgi:predicted RNA methylase
MNAIVIEHVKVSELPEEWRARLHTTAHARVTVRIEEEAVQAATQKAETFVTNDPAFGIWRDREDMADVEAYVRKLRAPRNMRDLPCWSIPMY